MTKNIKIQTKKHHAIAQKIDQFVTRNQGEPQTNKDDTKTQPPLVKKNRRYITRNTTYTDKDTLHTKQDYYQ